MRVPVGNQFFLLCRNGVFVPQLLQAGLTMEREGPSEGEAVVQVRKQQHRCVRFVVVSCGRRPHAQQLRAELQAERDAHAATQRALETLQCRVDEEVAERVAEREAGVRQAVEVRWLAVGRHRRGGPRAH